MFNNSFKVVRELENLEGFFRILIKGFFFMCYGGGNYILEFIFIVFFGWIYFFLNVILYGNCVIWDFKIYLGYRGM